MKKILILNGPNLNLQGKRDVNIYGTTTFEEYTAALTERYAGVVEFDYMQSNVEGELINALHASVGMYDGVVLGSPQGSDSGYMRGASDPFPPSADTLSAALR